MGSVLHSSDAIVRRDCPHTATRVAELTTRVFRPLESFCTLTANRGFESQPVRYPATPYGNRKGPPLRAPCRFDQTLINHFSPLAEAQARSSW